MTKIPDDVVERLWQDLCEKSDRTSPAEYPDMALITLGELRATLRVGVEWEREQCAKIAEGEKFGWSNFYQRFLYCRWPWRKEGSSTTHSNESVLADEIAAAIRARSAPEKSGDRE